MKRILTEKEEEIRKKNIKSAFEQYVQNRNRNYKMVGEIASNGAFSVVYEVKDENGSPMVMKAVDTHYLSVEISPREVMKYTNIEIETMKKCESSPYVMKLIDAADVTVDNAADEHVFLLFMPKMQMSVDYFNKIGYAVPEILSLAKDICKALDFCHSKNILHRDVKPENIYYSPKDGHFILADFGAARYLQAQDNSVTIIGSYIAPEILGRMDLHGRMNADIYSIGRTVLNLLAWATRNKTAIYGNTPNAEINNVFQKAADENPVTRYQTAKELLNAIESLEAKRCNAGAGVPDVHQCVDAFLKNDIVTAERIAKDGHGAGIPVMTCLYAYILTCKSRINEALDILRPLKDRGDGVAMGLYGIIGRLETTRGNTVSDSAKDRELISMIHKSADLKFSVAQYYIGRWMIDGESGFTVNIDKGLDYIFASVQRGYVPAMYYFKKALTRNNTKFKSIQSMVDLANIMLKDFSENDLPDETFRAIASAY